jgi:hypothetical protein
LFASNAKEKESAQNVRKLLRVIPRNTVVVVIQYITTNVGKTKQKYVINAPPCKVTLN